MTDTKKMAQIKQMLRKAESTTPEEAEMIQARVEKMMLRMGIEEADLAAHQDEEPQKHVKRTIIIERPYADGFVRAASSAINGLGTVFMLQCKYSDKYIKLDIYGRESQVERAEMLGNSIIAQADSTMWAWWKANREMYSWETASRKWLARRQFIISFGHGAWLRLQEEQRVVKEETGGSSALVLRDAQSAAEDFAKETLGDSTFRKGRSLSGDSSAAYAGRQAGRQANVGTTALGGAKAAIEN